jgi:hypothetical protein
VTEEVDPGLDAFYVPTHPKALSGAIDLTDKGWKGTARPDTRRGARLTTPFPPRARQVYVPDVGDARRDRAKAAIERAGLVASFSGDPRPNAYVESQAPAPGDVVRLGTVVTMPMCATPPQV